MGTIVSRTEHPNITAKALGVSAQTLARYAREGIVPFDTTPKGHRRYNTEEVVEALRWVKEPTVFMEPLGFDELVFGSEVVMSPQSRMSQDLRATYTSPITEDPVDISEIQAPSTSAFDEMLSSAKRVLVTVG
ncbi:MerR family DNA-binding transcriptional regulator [Arthrobacter sp. Soc17.1.1.1]|uniref:MerR family DNA-binding transcriptional regulator n=1 Tax=Arthrobacter sp. Soc17.1.1.1 TaxID=3121277 RepID=UPI002FE4C1B4